MKQIPPSFSDPPSPSSRARERHIPIRRSDLAESLSKAPDLSDGEREQFRDLVRLIAATFHFEFHSRLEELKTLYAPFDPDGEQQHEANVEEQESPQLAPLLARIDELLLRANYLRLDTADIARAAAVAKASGIRLSVDLDAFDRLAVYARGDRFCERRLRGWRTLYRPRTYWTSAYQRLVVVFRLREARRGEPAVDPHALHLKLFKNIPKTELDMLLPGAKVKITRLDQGKIWLPTISGVGMTAVKLLGAPALLFTNVWALLGVIGGTIGYGAKSFFGHQRAKDKHNYRLTRSLFYQNLDNNAGVLFRLIDEAEEQECREAMLAYYFLWRRAPPEGWPLETLDQHVETWLREQAGIVVDFEVEDAWSKLLRLGLAESLPDGRRRVCPIDEALVKLDRAWDNCFRYGALPGSPQR